MTKVYIGLDQRALASQTAITQKTLTVESGGKKTVIFSGSVGDPNKATGFDAFVQTTDAQIDPSKVVVSQNSTVVFHSTLFENFSLRAKSTYNFYTVDEQQSFEADVSASLNSIPRYVTLTWNPTPTIRVLTPSSKGMKPADARTDRPKTAVAISTAKTSVANGYVGPGTISALLVQPVVVEQNAKFDEDLFLSSQDSDGLHALDYVDGSTQFHVQQIAESPTRVRVNFVDPSIAGAVDDNRIAISTEQTHLASLGAIAKFVGALEVISEFNQDVPVRNPAPQFTVSADTPGLIYVGYVIERFTLDSDGGMRLTRTFDIDDPKTTRIVDREVVFGGRYAYRIKSIVQWSRPENYDFFGKSKFDLPPAFDTTKSALTKRASFYSGDWSDWAKTEIIDDRLPLPPDEFTVRPVSNKQAIHVSWKMPWDPQRDLASFILLRSRSISGRYENWKALGEFVPGNGLYIDNDVEPNELNQISYMYAMYSTSYHGEISVLTEKIEASLTNRSRYLGEQPVTLIGPTGDDPMDYAKGPESPPETTLTALFRASAYIRGAKSSLPLFDRNYAVEVQSLATGERTVLDLAVDSTDVDLIRSGASRRA
jgi:hypothetical protein